MFFDYNDINFNARLNLLQGTVMQIEEALINDRLSVSIVSWKFCIPIIYNFAVIDPWNLLFS